MRSQSQARADAVGCLTLLLMAALFLGALALAAFTEVGGGPDSWR
ncbi:hypothetical protein [Kitasatospora sp. P5_F3]